MKILFSCMGTTDPVRGYRDGPMLHILRHYRPDRMTVFLTDEAAGLDRKGKRIQSVLRHMKENWDGYAPETEIIHTDIKDPSDIDIVAKPMEEAITALRADYPQAEIILNLSSGTPQMKQVLAMVSADIRFKNILAVQVKNPDERSGSTERTNAENYSVGDELECNDDEHPGLPNRCTLPELLYQKRRQDMDQIRTLLEKRDYTAVYAMKNKMPDRLKALVGHLDARDRMQTEQAEKLAESLKPPFSLYPAASPRVSGDYKRVSEFYLVLLNRLHRRQYEELVLRLNPLVINLQLKLMQKEFDKLGVRLGDVINRPFSDRPRFDPEALRGLLPDVYDKVVEQFGSEPGPGDVKLRLCLYILRALPEVDGEILETFDMCDRLNNGCRNALAHALTAFSDAQMKQACGVEPARLLNRVGDVIAALYPECDRRLFDIYKRCGDYIIEEMTRL